MTLIQMITVVTVMMGFILALAIYMMHKFIKATAQNQGTQLENTLKTMFAGQEQQNTGHLNHQQEMIDKVVGNLNEELRQVKTQFQEMEKERKQDHGSMSEHIRNVAKEASSLTKTMYMPKARGTWGELHLARVLEMAGLSKGIDYEEQVSYDEGAKKPDVIVHLPEGGIIPIDAKTPFDAYMAAVNAEDATQYKAGLIKHALTVKKHVDDLAKKAYWASIEGAPDMVLLYLPAESLFYAAIQGDSNIIEYAARKNIMICSPSSLLPVLKAVAHAWKQRQLAENAKKIAELGHQLHDRIAILSSHFSKVGKSLDQAVGHYNATIGSYETKVLPGARKLGELGIESNKALADTQIIEKRARVLKSEMKEERVA